MTVTPSDVNASEMDLAVDAAAHQDFGAEAADAVPSPAFGSNSHASCDCPTRSTSASAQQPWLPEVHDRPGMA